MSDPVTLSAARKAAARAAQAVVDAQAPLVALRERAVPAKVAIAAVEAAAALVASLRREDAERRADALAMDRQVEPNAARVEALAEAERDAVEAERQAEAGRVLLGRLSRSADEVRERIAVAEQARHAAAVSLVSAEHLDALTEWDRAVEALGNLMTRIDAVDLAADQLGYDHRGTRAARLREALTSERLAISTWGHIGLDRPSWLYRSPDAAGADALLAVAGFPSGYRAPRRAVDVRRIATDSRITVTVFSPGEDPSGKRY